MRLCELTGIGRATYYRRRERARTTRASPRGPWPRPVRWRIATPARLLALEWPAWGHRKHHALLAIDGFRASPATVLRALRDQGLALPAGFQRERRQLARQRRRTFLAPVTARNQVWQMDFSQGRDDRRRHVEPRRPGGLLQQARARVPDLDLEDLP